jgi:hypothetical protein
VDTEECIPGIKNDKDYLLKDYLKGLFISNKVINVVIYIYIYIKVINIVHII